MNKLAALILLSFVALVSIGFTTMAHQGHEDSGECIVAVLDKVLCDGFIAGNAIHHVDAYKTFTNIIVSAIVLLALAISLLWFIEFKASRFRLSFAFTKDQPHIRTDSRVLRWLSLFINSPSLA